jgi:DNA-binding transcriptional ArsR family regulator
MTEEKITLDRESFKSLASGTRISILKSLHQRRKMLAELSKELGMSPSTVKEHMDSLRKAELVQLKDEGHKWKYYELTRKGRNVLNPGEARIWILLSLSGLAFIVTAYDMLYSGIANLAARSQPLMKPAGDVLTEMGAPAAEPVAAAAQQLPLIHIAGLVIFAVIFALAAGYYLGKKRKLKFPF